MTYKAIQDMVLAQFKESLRPNAKEWVKAVYGIVWDLEDWTFKHETAYVTATSGSTALSNVPADLGIPHLLQNEYGDELEYLQQRDFEALYYTELSGTPCHFTVYGDTPNPQIKVGPPPDATSALWQLVYERAAGKYPSSPLTTGVTFPADTLHVDTTQMASSGDVLLAGQKISYTGKTSSTLTGCTGGSGSVLVDEPVVALQAIAGDLYADTDVPLLPAHTHMLLVHGAQAIGQTAENDPTAALSDDRVTSMLEGMRRRYLEQERGASDDQYGTAYSSDQGC